MKTSVKIICDSVSSKSPHARITTFEIEYPRFILAEINTHRIITKSTASSRAIPLKKRIEMVEKHPFIPSSFGRNKPGMQASEALEGEEAEKAKTYWLQAAEDAVVAAKRMLKLKVHKQTANRILEPFSYVKTVLTGTEWENFFKLRTSKEAQPEFRELALMMQEALQKSTPVVLSPGEWHMPYVTGDDAKDPAMTTADLLKISCARCARVSYKLHDGTPSPIEKDLKLYADLANMQHLSPMDHPAQAGEAIPYRQYFGFKPFRIKFEREGYIIGSSLNMFEKN